MRCISHSCSLLVLSMSMYSIGEGHAALAHDDGAVGIQPRSLSEYSNSPGKGYVNIFLPVDPPMPRSEMKRWLDILEASDAQARFIELEYERFVGAINERLDELIPDHLDASSELYRIREHVGTSTPEFFEAMKAQLQHHNRIVRDVHQVEQRFIESLRPVLTPEQQRHLHVLHARAKRYWLRLDHLPTRGIEVDLYDVWLDLDDALADRDLHNKVADILASHEVRLTTLYQQVETLRQEHLIAFRRDKLRVLDNEITQADLSDAYLRRRDRRVNLGQQVRRLIDTTTQQVASIVPAHAAEEWTARIQTELFPELYPNPVNLQPLLAALKTDPNIEQSQKAAVEAIGSEYSAESKQMHDRLVDFITEWGDRGTRGEQGYLRQFLSDALDPELKTRRDLSQRYLEHLKSIVGREALARHAEAVPAALESELENLLLPIGEAAN